MPPLPAHQPTLTNLQLLRSPDIPSLALGEFGLAPGLPARMDRSLAIRAEIVRAPGDGSFSSYLRQTLEAELTGAGKLNAAAGTTISAQLTQSRVETLSEDATAVLGARFIVSRGGQVIYNEEHVVTDTWATTVLGGIAIPEAMDHYNALHPAIVSDLLRSEALKRAVRAPTS